MYWLSPSADLSGREEVWATWKDAFSDAEIAAIITLGENNCQRDATIGEDGSVDPKIRKTKVSWIDQSNESIWLFDKIGHIARQLNAYHYNFDLTGFSEGFQYTVYNDPGAHYDWHIDKGVMGGQPPRKLSLVLQLSDPSEYEGGELQLLYGKEPVAMERGKGLVIGFPSWVLHRVTPITKGTRRSLVIWTCGPKFK